MTTHERLAGQVERARAAVFDFAKDYKSLSSFQKTTLYDVARTLQGVVGELNMLATYEQDIEG